MRHRKAILVLWLGTQGCTQQLAFTCRDPGDCAPPLVCEGGTCTSARADGGAGSSREVPPSSTAGTSSSWDVTPSSSRGSSSGGASSGTSVASSSPAPSSSGVGSSAGTSVGVSSSSAMASSASLPPPSSSSAPPSSSSSSSSSASSSTPVITVIRFDAAQDCTVQGPSAEVSGGTVHLLPVAGWGDTAFAYRVEISVTSSALAGPGVEHTWLDVDSTPWVDAGKARADHGDLRLFQGTTPLPLQVEGWPGPSSRIHMVVGPPSQGSVLLYMGNATAVADTATALATTTSVSDVMVKRRGANYARVDLTATRTSLFGTAMGSFTGLWTDGLESLGPRGTIRYSSLVWQAPNGEGEMAGITSLSAVDGPVFTQVDLAGASYMNQFSHQVRYRIYPDGYAAAHVAINAINPNKNGMDSNRAPIPAAVGLDTVLPDSANGVAQSQGWAVMSNAATGAAITLAVPEVPGATRTRWGLNCAYDWLDHRMFGSGGFGGWRLRPTQEGSFAAAATAIQGTEVFDYVVRWGPVAGATALAADTWQRLAHPPSVVPLGLQSVFPTLPVKVAVNQVLACSVLLGLQQVATGAVGYLFTPNGTDEYGWDGVQGHWVVGGGGARGTALDDVNLHASTLMADLGGHQLGVRVVLSSTGVDAVSVDTVVVECLP